MRLSPFIDRLAYLRYVRFRFIAIPLYVYTIIKFTAFHQSFLEVSVANFSLEELVYFYGVYAVFYAVFASILLISSKAIYETIKYWFKKYIVRKYYDRQQRYIIKNMLDRYLFFRGCFKGNTFFEKERKVRLDGFGTVENVFLGLQKEVQQMIREIDAHDYHKIEAYLYSYDINLLTASFIFKELPMKGLVDTQYERGYSYVRLMGEIFLEMNKNLDPKAVASFRKRYKKSEIFDPLFTIKHLSSLKPSSGYFHLTKASLLDLDHSRQWGEDSSWFDYKDDPSGIADGFYEGTTIHREGAYSKNEIDLSKRPITRLTKYGHIYLASAIVGVPAFIYWRLYLYTFYSVTFFHISWVARIYYFWWLVMYLAIASRYLYAKYQVYRWQRRSLRSASFFEKVQRVKRKGEARTLLVSHDTVIIYAALDQLDKKHGLKSLPSFL